MDEEQSKYVFSVGHLTEMLLDCHKNNRPMKVDATPYMLKMLQDLNDKSEQLMLGFVGESFDLVDDMLEELKQEIKTKKWHSIEDAPKDGTHVLIFEENSEFPVVAAYHNGVWVCQTEAYLADEAGNIGTNLDQDLVLWWYPLMGPPAK